MGPCSTSIQFDQIAQDLGAYGEYAKVLYCSNKECAQNIRKIHKYQQDYGCLAKSYNMLADIIKIDWLKIFNWLIPGSVFETNACLVAHAHWKWAGRVKFAPGQVKSY